MQEGWYPSPTDADLEIFWDGASWSGNSRLRANDADSAPSTDGATHDGLPVVVPQNGHQPLTAAGTTIPERYVVSSRTSRLELLKHLPLWLRVTGPAVLLVAVVILIVVVATPRGGAVAEAQCRAAVVEAMRAPSKAEIVNIETKAAPTTSDSAESKEWAKWLNALVIPNSVDQVSDVVQLMGSFGADSDESEDGSIFFKPNTYSAIGKVDGTNSFDASARMGFVCMIKVEGTDVKQAAKVAFFG